MARDGIEKHSRREGAFFEVKHTNAPTRQQTTHLLLLEKVRHFGWNLKGHFCIDEIVYQGNTSWCFPNTGRRFGQYR